MTWEQFVARHLPSPARLSVKVLLGAGTYGPVFADPVEVSPCAVEAQARLVRSQVQDTAGQEVTSSTTVWGPLGMEVTPGSLVDVEGRWVQVLSVSRVRAHGRPLPEHTELALE